VRKGFINSMRLARTVANGLCVAKKIALNENGYSNE
jgi:hypothetical protein